jgi:hypothetical protein
MLRCDMMLYDICSLTMCRYRFICIMIINTYISNPFYNVNLIVVVGNISAYVDDDFLWFHWCQAEKGEPNGPHVESEKMMCCR